MRGRRWMAPDRSVVIFGAGAVGGYLGGRLAGSPGINLTLVGREDLARAVARHGLTVREDPGETVTHPHVVRSAAQLLPADLVMLTVRTYDVEAAIPDVRKLMGTSGILLAFQNGVGTEERLAAALGRERILAATQTVSTGIEQPGVIARYSQRGGIAIASMSGGPVPAWVVDVCRATGLPAVTRDDYRSLRWSKLLLNMLGAPVSAILDVDMRTIASNPYLFRVEQLAFREATRVMDALGVRTVSLPGYPVPQARIAMRLPRPLAQRLFAPRLIASRGGRAPGMRLDIARGKTEIAAFSGAVADEARRRGVRAPVNAALTDLTECLAANPGERERYRGRPDRLLAYLGTRGARVA